MKCLPFTSALLAALALTLSPSAASTTNIDGAYPDQPVVTGAPVLTEPVPPAPPGLILDNAAVFHPEAAARLSAYLSAARAKEVHVFVATLPSLGVRSSKQTERLSERAREIVKVWLPHKIGAVILFDDESGLMSVDLSAETESRFTGFAVEDSLREPLRVIQESGLARDKLEGSAKIVVDTLVALQTKWIADTRHHQISNLIMAAVGLLGVGLAIYTALPKTNDPAVAAPKPEADSTSPVDF